MAKYVIRKQEADGGWPKYIEVDDVNELSEEVANAVRLLDVIDAGEGVAFIPGVGRSSAGGGYDRSRPFYRNYYLCMFEHPGRRRRRTV